MVPSLLTACLFAASGICGRRAALGLGALRANCLRLTIAAVLLGMWVLWHHPIAFGTRAVNWLLVSGVVGFGFGDVCLFLAYPRIGARLTLLVSLCSAPVFGAVLDWMLRGTQFTPWQAVTSLMILTGVGAALLGGHGNEGRWRPGSEVGVIAASMAGLGQGCGAALSRYAQALASADHMMINGVSQAFIRTLPGAAYALVVWLLFGQVRRAAPGPAAKHRWAWLAGAVMFGPVVGVSCFQWALSLQSSIVVLSVTATAPVLIMPLAARIDHDPPARAAVVGGLLAVAGVVLLLHAGAS
jgi:drug/metabolite transporter (DMT)-like permease